MKVPSSSMSHQIRRLVWHRRDLRLHDNPIYNTVATSIDRDDDEEMTTRTTATTASTTSLYVFDSSHFQPRPSTCEPLLWNAVDVGPHAAAVLLEAVADLRRSIRSTGGELFVRIGNPLEIVPRLAEQLNVDVVTWNEEPGFYEMQLSRKMKNLLLSNYRVELDVCCTLWHPNDLPIDVADWERLAHPKRQTKKRKSKRATKSSSKCVGGITQTNNVPTEGDMAERLEGMPPIMGDFRRAVRTFAPIRTCLTPRITWLLPTTFLDAGEIPTLQQLMTPLLTTTTKPILGMDHHVIKKVVNHAIANHDKTKTGGETAALKRLEFFIKKINNDPAFSNNRAMADVTTNNDSSQLSVHLAVGTLSPRMVIEKIQQQGRCQEDCQWLISHLEMRDFFLYSTWKADYKIFRRAGLPVCGSSKQQLLVWKDPMDFISLWKPWAFGKTGLPLIDAAMRELMSTGYCSNRVRQNAASALVKDLNIDWRAGAEWFQFLLQDHCVAANWGNWMYFSGVGADPKHRHFRTVSQSKRYDPEGQYISKWLPEVAGIPGGVEAKWRPWDFNDAWESIVDPKTQYTWHDLQLLEETGSLLEIQNNTTSTTH